MHAFAEKQKTSSLIRSAPARSVFGPDREINSQPPLQRASDHQATSRSIKSGKGSSKGDQVTTENTGLGHDFSRISLSAASPTPGMQKGVKDRDNDTFGFSTLRVSPILSPGRNMHSSPTLPTINGEMQDVFDPPQNGGGSTAPGGTSPPASTTTANSCSQPLSMNKIVSGAFLGGLTMDSYFPDLSGRGFWDHAGTGGPFDTGTQAGGNAQLFGVIPSPCDPSRFHLEQTANPVRFRIGGVSHALEGTTFDDIARSGRDFSRPPARQDFLGGGTAPLGYIISMADPPSVNYSASRPDVERDTNFVTSLVGPGGRKSVSWSQSVRVAGGSVTVNTLT